jgi:hypothetical protein
MRRFKAGVTAGLAAAVALAFASDVASRRAADDIEARAQLVMVETRIVVLNRGTTTLLFDRGLVPNGKVITTATQDGQACRFSGIQFNCGPFSAPPGSQFTIALQTTPPLAPEDGPLLLWVSSDGRTDTGPFTVPWQTAQPPPPPPTPPPPPPPCTCRNIGTTTSGFADFTRAGAGTTAFSFRVQWRMNCSGRPGKCEGEIEVLPPGRTDLKLSAPKRAVDCKGTCRAGEAITQSRGRFRVAGSSVESLDRDARGGKSFSFRIKRYCIRGGKRVAAGGTFMTVVYRPSGLLDLAKSDLNGDRKPDGRRRG